MRKKPKPSQPGLEFGDLRLSWLQTFVVVSRSGTRSEAGKKLGGITQSTVTKHIQSLERWSQKVLLHPDRVPKLTEQGAAFVSVADDILEVMAKARKPLVTPAEPKRTSVKDLRAPPSVPKPPKV